MEPNSNDSQRTSLPDVHNVEAYLASNPRVTPSALALDAIVEGQLPLLQALLSAGADPLFASEPGWDQEPPAKQHKRYGDRFLRIARCKSEEVWSFLVDAYLPIKAPELNGAVAVAIYAAQISAETKTSDLLIRTLKRLISLLRQTVAATTPQPLHVVYPLIIQCLRIPERLNPGSDRVVMECLSVYLSYPPGWLPPSKRLLMTYLSTLQKMVKRESSLSNLPAALRDNHFRVEPIHMILDRLPITPEQYWEIMAEFDLTEAEKELVEGPEYRDHWQQPNMRPRWWLRRVVECKKMMAEAAGVPLD